MRKHMGRINRGTTQIPARFHDEQTLNRRNVLLRLELLNRTAFTWYLCLLFLQAAPVGNSGHYLNLRKFTAGDFLSL